MKLTIPLTSETIRCNGCHQAVPITSVADRLFKQSRDRRHRTGAFYPVPDMRRELERIPALQVSVLSSWM